MKELRRNMRAVGVALLALFIGAGVWLGATAYTQGDTWASNVYNPRLARTASERGDITDRTGGLLASTNSEGQRAYLTNEDARRALSQTCLLYTSMTLPWSRISARAFTSPPSAENRYSAYSLFAGGVYSNSKSARLRFCLLYTSRCV